MPESGAQFTVRERMLHGKGVRYSSVYQSQAELAIGVLVKKVDARDGMWDKAVQTRDEGEE